MTNSEPDNQKVEMDFAALGLYPGATMQIQAIDDVSPMHHWVKFIGFINHSSILTTLPFEDGKGMWIQPGKTFVVRGFNGKYAYAFTVQTIRARANPFAYIHFSWPHSIESQIVRHSRRIDVALPVNISKMDNTSVATTLFDISVSGAMLDSAAELGAIGDKIHVELVVNLAGNTVKMNVLATIRNVHQNKDGEDFKTGIEFNDVSQNDHLMLNYFIDSVAQVG